MRPIDADALLKNWERDRGMMLDADYFIFTTVHAPTIDAVPVVRCENCKFGDWYDSASGERLCYCTEHGRGGYVPTDFCSYGEREDDDEN